MNEMVFRAQAEDFSNVIEIVVARELEEALRLLPQADMAVIDQTIIGGKGDEVARQAVSLGIPYARWAIGRPGEELFAEKATDRIPKPCRGDALVAAIGRLIAASSAAA